VNWYKSYDRKQSRYNFYYYRIYLEIMERKETKSEYPVSKWRLEAGIS
jgi:hypothetical protein